MQKTRKSFSKRFKVTPKKKILKRYASQDHYNARDTGKITRKKRRDKVLSKTVGKTIKAAIGQL